MEKSIKILRDEENFERKKQSMFHNHKFKLRKFCKPKFKLRKFRNHKFKLRKFCKPKFSLRKISQTPIYLANALHKFRNSVQPYEHPAKIKKPLHPHFATQNNLRKLRGFTNLFRNPETSLTALQIPIALGIPKVTC